MNRPTAPAHWWNAPHANVLGGRDLERSAQGTWLGITKQGRIALLTNFRDENERVVEERSRGEIAKSYLTLPMDSKDSPKDFARDLVERGGAKGVGGFSLIFGQLRRNAKTGLTAPLGVISNRTPDAEGIIWIGGEDDDTQAWTCSLSNSRYGDDEWPKVTNAEQLLKEAVKVSSGQGESQEQLLNRCFQILNTDDLPRWKPGQDWKTYTREMRKSIFIPALPSLDESTAKGSEVTIPEGGEQINKVAGRYGTQKQTVILVDRDGKVTFIERTLYDENGHSLRECGQERHFTFQIDDWSSEP